MKQNILRFSRAASVILTSLIAALMLAMSPSAQAVIEGVTGPTFELEAKPGYISTADGNSQYMWGFANAGVSPVTMQYPGPTLIVNQGDTVTVNLSNALPVPVSIMFPGQSNVVTSANPGSAPGEITQEALVGGNVTYTFDAIEPGTYMYHSATQQALQIEMGLTGTLIVRPAAADPLHQAYSHEDTQFDHEYLFFLTEIDPSIHDQVESQVLAGEPVAIDFSHHAPTLWFINGRTGPDTMLEANVPWLPNQPYNIVPRMHPGEKILLRVIGAGRDLHPFHTHGNNTWLMARDGRMLESAPGMGPDLATSNYTIQTVPGQTYDATFEWTGEALNWDIYGHAPGDAMEPSEYAPDHGKPFPEISAGVPMMLPNILDLAEGQFYSGSPFLGSSVAPRPGQARTNEFGGYFHMWHSHNEKELANDDVFPGGMMTMVIIEPHGVPIPNANY